MTRLNLAKIFSKPLMQWFAIYGRTNLPWQLPRTSYKVWISEIMLQQTQVRTVIPYFERFIERFPTLEHLAQAEDDEVLALWSGLGYYSRARNLHQTAKIVMQKYKGNLPADFQLLKELPGIGPSTAAAIAAQAFNQPVAILDGNVKRVLSRFFLIQGYPEQAKVKNTLWELASRCMPKENCADYTQAIMDLGALCCTNKNPNCTNCPLQSNCLAFKHKEQHLYPTKKVKKIIPLHYEKLLVLYDEQRRVYLEKRPPTGIWGGLWCLPSVDKERCPLDFIYKTYDLSGDSPQQLIHFKHRFSHFHLQIAAFSIKTKALGNRVADYSGQWFAQEQISFLGLAQPTSKILSYYYEEKLI